MPQDLVALRERREAVIARLSDSYATDVLDVEELDRRLDLAHAATTVAELDALVADLGATTSTALVPAASQAIDDPNRPGTKKLRIVMGSVERRNRWIVPRTMHVTVFWGNAELDFREASMGPGVTTLDARVIMGSILLILPPTLSIDVDASSFAGSVEERHRMAVDPDPARPLLRVVGSVWFGSLEIVTRLPGESRRDAQRREKRERRALRADERKQLRSGSKEM
jgi:hypothetical protein